MRTNENTKVKSRGFQINQLPLFSSPGREIVVGWTDRPLRAPEKAMPDFCLDPSSFFAFTGEVVEEQTSPLPSTRPGQALQAPCWAGRRLPDGPFRSDEVASCAPQLSGALCLSPY